MKIPLFVAVLALALVLLGGVAVAYDPLPAYVVVEPTGMIPPSPQNNDGWYLLFDEAGASGAEQQIGEGSSFTLNAASNSGLWLKMYTEYGDVINVTLYTAKGKTFYLGFVRVGTGAWVPFGTPSDYIDTWSDLPAYEGGGSFVGRSGQLTGFGGMGTEDDSAITIRYARNYLTEQNAVDVVVGSATSYLIPLRDTYDVIVQASVTSNSPIRVNMYNTGTQYFNTSNTSPTVATTDLPAYVGQAISTLITVFNTVLLVITVGFSLFKIFIIDHGVTTFLLLELGGLFFYVTKYKTKRGGIFDALRSWLGMNDKIAHSVIDFSVWAVAVLTNVIGALSTAVNAGIALGGNLVMLGVTLLRAIL